MFEIFKNIGGVVLIEDFFKLFQRFLRINMRYLE
jgi:hypothetical protein